MHENLFPFADMATYLAITVSKRQAPYRSNLLKSPSKNSG